MHKFLSWLLLLSVLSSFKQIGHRGLAVYCLRHCLIVVFLNHLATILLASELHLRNRCSLLLLERLMLQWGLRHSLLLLIIYCCALLWELLLRFLILCHSWLHYCHLIWYLIYLIWLWLLFIIVFYPRHFFVFHAFLYLRRVFICPLQIVLIIRARRNLLLTHLSNAPWNHRHISRLVYRKRKLVDIKLFIE